MLRRRNTADPGSPHLLVNGAFHRQHLDLRRGVDPGCRGRSEEGTSLGRDDDAMQRRLSTNSAVYFELLEHIAGMERVRVCDGDDAVRHMETVIAERSTHLIGVAANTSSPTEAPTKLIFGAGFGPPVC